ncbi:MAG: hypothetical protein JWQ43_2644 [Glaciihabitans sp.]|nr:hypothetical protein [Glaciihabitans sp.]
MSSNLAYSLNTQLSRLTGAAGEKHNPWEENPRQIEIVTSRAQRRARPRLAYALVAVGGLMVIFLAQLMLSIALSNGAYTISSLQVENRNLGRVEGSLNESLEVAGSTQNLAANAQSLGMVSTTAPAFLNLQNGSVIGAAVAAPAASASTSQIANSLLTGAPVVNETPPAGALAETDTGTGDAATDTTAATTGSTAGSTAVASTGNSAVSGAPAAADSTPSVASPSGVLPSVTTR